MKKICKNCKHLFISGMLQDRGSTAGYCLLINLKTEGESKKKLSESIKQITDSCSKFDKK